MKQVKQKTAVFKNGKRTAKSDMHTNHRNSVFQKNVRTKDPLMILLMEERATTPTANKGK